MALIPYEEPVAVMELENGTNLNVYPSLDSENFDQANPFYYEQGATITRDPNTPVYRSDESRLRLLIHLPRPSETVLDRTMQDIARLYSVSGTQISAAAVRLRPLEVCGYQVICKAAGREIVLQEQRVDPDNVQPVSGTLAVDVIISDQDIHNELVTRPETINFVIRPFHLFTVVNAVQVYISNFAAATISAFSEIAGGGSNHDSVLVDRTALDQLEKIVRTRILVEVFLPENGIDNGFVTQALKQFTDGVKPLSLADLQQGTSQALIAYGPDQARIEMAPSEFRTLTTSLETSNQLRSFVERTWDKLSDISAHSSDTRDFHKQLKEYMKGAGETGGKLNILKFGGEANLKLNLETNTEDLNTGHLQEIEDAREVLRDTGSRKNDSINNAYQKWAGESYSDGKQLSKLDIYRVSSSDLIQQMDFAARQVSSRGKRARGKRFEFQSVMQRDQTSWDQVMHRLVDERITLNEFRRDSNEIDELLQAKYTHHKFADIILSVSMPSITEEIPIPYSTDHPREIVSFMVRFAWEFRVGTGLDAGTFIGYFSSNGFQAYGPTGTSVNVSVDSRSEVRKCSISASLSFDPEWIDSARARICVYCLNRETR